MFKPYIFVSFCCLNLVFNQVLLLFVAICLSSVWMNSEKNVTILWEEREHFCPIWMTEKLATAIFGCFWYFMRVSCYARPPLFCRDTHRSCSLLQRKEKNGRQMTPDWGALCFLMQLFYLLWICFFLFFLFFSIATSPDVDLRSFKSFLFSISW
jgi:hypothetical protein